MTGSMLLIALGSALAGTLIGYRVGRGRRPAEARALRDLAWELQTEAAAISNPHVSRLFADYAGRASNAAYLLERRF